MATEADSPELIHLEETEKRNELGCNQFDKTVFRASLGELQKVEDGPALAPEIDQNSAKAEESGVAQYAKNEIFNPVIDDKVGISEGESFLESPSLTKFALREICQASEDSGNKEKPSHEENDTLKKETKLQEDQTDESDEVTDGLNEGDKVDTSVKHVPVDMKGENVKPEDEKLAKSSELFTAKKPYELVPVTDGLTEGDKVDASGKQQVPADMKEENVKPVKSSELFTEEKTDEAVEVTDGLAEGDKVGTFGKLSPVEKKGENLKPEDEQPVKSSELFTEEKPYESVTVTDGLTEGGKVGTSGKQVPVDMKEEHVKSEDEQPAKSSELFTEEKADEPVEVTDGLTEGEKVDTSGKQAPVEKGENIKPEDKQLAKSSELFTEEKNVEEHTRKELFSSPIPSASAIPNLQELETLGSHDEVIEQKKQNAAEFSENKHAALEENLQRGDVVLPHLLKSSETVYDEPTLQMIHTSQSIEKEKEINSLQRDETEGKKSCIDLNLEPRDDTQTPQTAETTMGHDQEPPSPTADYVEQSLKTDVVTGGESENIEEIKEKSNDQESCNKEESTDKNSDIRDEPIKSDLREISFQEEELESEIQQKSFNPAGKEKGPQTMSQTEESGNENSQNSPDNSLATASPNIRNGEAENIKNYGSRSDKVDTPVTMVKEETGYQKAVTEESEMPEYTTTYSLGQRSQEIIEKEMNDGSLLEEKIQDESSIDNIKRVETTDEEVPEQSQQREESGLVELERSAEAVTEVLETAILSSDDKEEAYQEEDRPAKNLAKSYEEERKAVQTNNNSDNREDGVQKEEHPNQVDSVDKMEKEVENPNKYSDGTPITCQLIEKYVQEEGEKPEEISKIELEEASHTNIGEEEKEPILESWEVNKSTGTANIEHDTEGTPTTELIQTRELDTKGEVFEGLEIATAGKEAGKQNIEEDVVKSPFITSLGEERVNEHSQELEVNESFKKGGEGEPAEKQVIEDVAAIVVSTISAGEEIVKGSSKNDEVLSHKLCEGLERSSADEEAEKQIMKDGAAADLSTVFAEEDTTNESSQEDEKAKKYEEKGKEPEEASMEIFEGTDFTKKTDVMASNDEVYNSHNVLNVTEATKEETIQKESTEKLANASLFMSELSKEQVKEHILEPDENTNDNPSTACTRSTTGQPSLYIPEQEDKVEEEIKHDIPVSASVTVAESEGQGEGEPLESSILASKEQDLKLIKENETKKCERLREDGTQDKDLETPLAEQIKEETSMQKEEPANPKEANKMGCEDIDKDNPNEECERTEAQFQNIETAIAVNKDVPEQSSQIDISKVENLRQVSMLSEGLVTAASSMNAEDNTCLKEQGSLENLEESFEEGRKGDEGRYADQTSKTETQNEEVVVFPDVAKMEQNLEAVELSQKIEGTASMNQNKEADDLQISHLLVEESVNGVSEKHEEVSGVKPEEEIHGEDGAPPDVEELMSETAEMSKSKESANSDNGKTIKVMTSKSIQTSETECIEITNINEIDSKSKDTDTKDNREDAAGSKEQISPTDLHKKGTEDGNTEERIIEEDSFIKDRNTVVLRYETIQSSHENEEDQKIVKEPVPELKEEDRACKTIYAEYSQTNAIQKEEVHDEPKIINSPDDTENIKEEICDAKDISIVSIGRETINESSEEDKKGEENPGGKVPDDLEVTGPSTDREQEVIEDNSTCKDHSALCTGENAVTQTYLEDEKQVKIHKNEVCAGPETADASKVIGQQIIENDDTLKAHYTISTGEEIIIMRSQEDEKEEKKPKIEECERIEAATEDEAHRKQSIEVDTIAGEYTESVGEVTAKESSPRDEVHERFEPTRSVQDTGHHIMDDEAITGFKMTSVREQTSTENHKEHEEEAQEQGEVKEPELPFTEEFEATDTIKETETVISEDVKALNKNSSAFSATIALGEELIQKEKILKFSEASPAVPEEHTKEKSLEKADNINNGCPSASVTIIAEKLSLQEAEPEGGKQVKGSTLASDEPSSAQVESGVGSTNLAVETMKLEEILNLDEYATKETTAGKLDAYEVEERKIPVGASALDQKIKATSGTETTDTTNVYHEKSEKIQESSMQISEKQELGSIDMDSKIKDETPLEHEIQDENLETPTAAQVKEELTMQTEEPRKIKEGVWMGSEDAMKENLLPESDHEKHISKSEDTDAILDMSKTAELTDFGEDRKLDNSSHCLEKNNSEGEQQPSSFPKELEKVDGCAKTEKDIPDHVESNTENHDHSFKDDRNECKNVMHILADAETEDHGCETITTSSIKKNNTLAQNLEASLIGEKSKSGTESVAEDQGHAILSITKEFGEIITDRETSSVEDQMAGQGFQNKGMESKNLDEAGPELKVEDRMINATYQPMKKHKLASEGIEKFPENEMVEKQTIEEENIATHLVEDETSNEVHNSDIAPVRSFEATDSIEKKEIDTLGETHLKKNLEASPVAEASGQDMLREGDFENLSEISIFSGGQEILKQAEDNVYKTDTKSVTVMAEEMKSQDAELEGETILEASGIGFEEKRLDASETIGTSIKGEKDKSMIDTESVTVMTEEMKSQDAEPEGETILEASGIGFEEKRVEAIEIIETSIRGEKDKSVELKMSLASQLPKFDENIDQKILTVEKLDKYNDGTTEEMQKDAQEKYEQIKNIEEVPHGERTADEISSSHDTTENKNSKDENAEAVNPGENIETKDIEHQEKITNEVLNTNSLVEEVLVGEVESMSEEAPNLESEKLEKALECVSQAHLLQVTDIITKETGNKEDECMVKEHDTVRDGSVENSFQEDKKTDRQLKEAEPIVEAEENQSEKISKVNESIQEEIVTEEISNKLESPAAIETTARKIPEAEEAVKDPCLILSEKRINECNEKDKKQGEKAQREAAKTEPEDQLHEQEVDKIQIEKTQEVKDAISYEKVQKEPENTDANESIEQITVEEGSIRDQYLVAVGEEIVQKNHQEDKMNKEMVKIAPVELKPEESSAKLQSEKDQDMKTDETNLTLEKGIINKEIKEVSRGLEKPDASEKFDRPIAEEKEAFKDLHLLHGHEGKVKEIHQKADLETEKVEEETSKLNTESQNQEENGRTLSKENEEINSYGLVVEMLELETAGSSYKTEPVTIKDDEGLSRKLDAPPNENAASKEVPREVSKELKDLSELVHEEPISEIIITNAPRMETATEDTDASKGLIELEKLKNAPDLECSSTGKFMDVHIKEEIPIRNSASSFPTDTEQQKLTRIEGKITENEERQDLAFASKAIAEVSLTTEEREDNNKNEAPEETLKNEAGAQELICEKEEQRNMISEQEETLCNIETMEKASEVTDEEHTTRASDSTEIVKTEISTGSEYIPSQPEDSIGQTSVEAEVEDQEPGEASRIESKVKGLEREEEKRVQDATEEPMTDSKLSDSDNVLLSGLLQRSTKETFQIVGAEERDPIAKNEKTENKETPSRPVEEQTAGEEEKDEDGEEEEDVHKIIDSGSDGPVMVEASKDIDVKPSQKKSHNLLSGMGSKVKHSIAKMKKVITGKSSQHKQSPPK